MTQKLPHVTAGKIHVRNSIEQLKLVGPRSMGVSLLTAGFVGMVFTIQVLVPACNALRMLTFPTCGYCMALNPSEPRVSQSGQKRRVLMYAESVAVLGAQFVREFAKLGLTRSVGGVLGLALARELTPVVTSIILAGKGFPLVICP